jgi:hypothetical protein
MDLFILVELAKLGNDCVDALQAHDDTTGSLEALNAAELKLKDILNSPSVDAACRKIDDLAEKKELDSALVLMLSKAWSAAKGTDITKSEVNDYSIQQAHICLSLCTFCHLVVVVECSKIVFECFLIHNA